MARVADFMVCSFSAPTFGEVEISLVSAAWGFVSSVSFRFFMILYLLCCCLRFSLRIHPLQDFLHLRQIEGPVEFISQFPLPVRTLFRGLRYILWLTFIETIRQ